MIYTILTAALLLLFLFFHQWHKKSKLNQFIRDVLQEYFRSKSLNSEHHGFLFQRVIESRYSTPDESRNLKHVLSLWNQYLISLRDEMAQNADIDEKDLLRQFLTIIGLVEKNEFTSLKEDQKTSLFNQIYSEFQPS